MVRRSIAVSALLASLAAAAPRLAYAQEAPGATVPRATAPLPALAPLPPTPTVAHWYGGELLAADALGAVVFALGVASDHDVGRVAAIGAIGSLMLTPAFLHVRHGHHGRAAASLGVRAGLPLAGALIGSATCTEDPNSDDWFQCFGSVIGGFGIGALAAIVIDDGALAWESRPAHAHAPTLQVGIAPRADHGMTVSVSGAF